MALFSYDGWLFLLRWFHFLAGITWIGLLYYFNFVQTPFFASAEAPVRIGMLSGGLVNRALWWFRWGAMFTFLTGWLMILHKLGQGGFFSFSYGWLILFGGLLGTLMWFNVWFIIWPAQQVLMASATQVSKGGSAIPEAAARGQRAGWVSRSNVLMSIPMLFFMGAASHLTSMAQPTSRGVKVGALIFIAIVLVAVEANAVLGKDAASLGKKILGNLKHTFWAGFILTAILYIGLELLFRR